MSAGYPGHDLGGSISLWTSLWKSGVPATLELGTAGVDEKPPGTHSEQLAVLHRWKVARAHIPGVAATSASTLTNPFIPRLKPTRPSIFRVVCLFFHSPAACGQPCSNVATPHIHRPYCHHQPYRPFLMIKRQRCPIFWFPPILGQNRSTSWR